MPERASCRAPRFWVSGAERCVLRSVSTLASLETVQNQLRSHFTILRQLGLTDTELQRLIAEIRQVNPSASS